MPLYRQAKTLARAGHGIARSVLCGMFHRTAEVLAPIYHRLLALVRLDPYVHADETSLKVLAPEAAKTGWIWTLLCNDIAAYVFSESRGAETAHHLLADTTGHLVCDGYAGYNGVVGEGLRRRAGCWAHSRRKFHDALSTAPEARELLDLIVKLYRVEYKAAQLGHLGTDAHQMLRDEESRPVLGDIEAWIDTHTDAVPPKSPLGQALSYATNQREQLRVFLDDPKVPLDNNVAERALRVIAVGRKNFLFVGHQEGGQNFAILQTICSTCQLHDVNPYEYIRDVVVRVRTHPNKQIDELLPMNWKPPPETAHDLWNLPDGSG
jgi:transposase